MTAGAAFVGALALLDGCGLPAAIDPQPPRVARIGYLGTGKRDEGVRLHEGFLKGLREHGYIEGENLLVEWRFAEGRAERLPELAAEMMALRVQAIVTSSTPAVVAAAKATRTIPIISGGPSRSLLELGLVQSDARPGGNVTGTGASFTVYGKLVELLRDAVPTIARVGYLWNPATPGTAEQKARSEAAAQALGLGFLELPARTPDDIDAALAAAVVAGADALVASADTLFSTGSDHRVVRVALQHRLPAIYSQVAGYIERGGLMGYSPDFVASQRRAAAYVDKILRGATPAELPVEQAMTFELAVNLRTASALGLTIPDHVLLQATELVQ